MTMAFMTNQRNYFALQHDVKALTNTTEKMFGKADTTSSADAANVAALNFPVVEVYSNHPLYTIEAR